MKYYVNSNIKKTERVFPVQGRDAFLRLDMNESVVGLPKEFVESVKEEITPEFLTRYPEPDKFLKKYADYINGELKDTGTSKIGTDNLMATNGTDMAIRYILETFGEPEKNVVTVSPTFEMYRINCSILGLNHVPVSYDEVEVPAGFIIDINKICSNISKNTCIVVLLNPNNPIGDTYSIEDAKRIIEHASENNAIVLIDEAYHYFTEESLLSLVSEYDNVILMRTFSKLMSLAAIRLGVIISNSDIIHYLKNGKLTFDVNSMALLFGERLLEHPEIIEDLIKKEREGKEYLIHWLKEKGYDYIPCKGNFVLVKTKTNPHELTKWLEKEKKILVHDYGNPILSDYIRISTADVESMKRVCEAMENGE